MASNSKYEIIKIILVGILFAGGLFSVVFNFSWIKAVVAGLLLFNGIVFAVSIRLHLRLCKRVFKCMLIGVLFFSLCFSVFEGHMFYNAAGYPPTFGASQSDVALSYPNILNASMIEIVQSVKNTPAFELLMLEHPGLKQSGDVTVESIIFRNGGLEVCLYSESSNLEFKFSASSGSPYRLSTSRYPSYPSHMMKPPRTPEENLQQIDKLGLQWYYDRAIETYQNETGIIPEINNLYIQINVDNSSWSPGMVIYMRGWYVNEGNTYYDFTAQFCSDGTLITFFVF